MTRRDVSEKKIVDAAVVDITNPAGAGGILFVCEHASNFIPAEYDNLGLDAAALSSHIAWDPGALALANRLSADLDCPVIAPRISRLIFDVNRPLDSASATPAQSEGWKIAGNENLSAEEREKRHQLCYLPFHDAVADQLDQGSIRAVVTIHSFTPVFNTIKRDVEIGILHDTDSRLADLLLIASGETPAYIVRRNEPYGAEDGVTHTLQKHAIPRGMANVMIEIRNDLLETVTGRQEIGDWLLKILSKSLEKLQDV